MARTLQSDREEQQAGDIIETRKRIIQECDNAKRKDLLTEHIPGIDFGIYEKGLIEIIELIDTAVQVGKQSALRERACR